jgi:hypothetical protein
LIYYFVGGKHRLMRLVFAKERSIEAIREALSAKRVMGTILENSRIAVPNICTDFIFAGTGYPKKDNQSAEIFP